MSRIRAHIPWASAAAGALLALALFAGGCGRRGEAADEGDVVSARRGTLVVWVSARGKVGAASSVVVTPPRYWGMKISRIIVKEGDRVEKGDVLMQLQTENLDDRVRDVTRDIKSSEESLESAKANLRSERDRLESAAQCAEQELAKTKQALEDIVRLPLPTDLRNAEIDRETKKKASEQAKVKYDTMKHLHDVGGASLKQVEEKEMDWRKADADANRADLVWQVTKDGSLPTTIRDAEITVEQAQGALDLAVRTRDLTVAQIEEQVRKSECWRDMNRRTLARLQAVQDACSVRAPIAGTAYYCEVWTPEGGQQKIKEGMEVWPKVRLMEIPDTSKMQILVEVEEADIGKVAVGQPARITLDAYRAKPFGGKVTRIEQLTRRKGGREMGRSDYEREDLGTRAVEVTVTFDDMDPLVRNGLNGRAEVRTAEKAQGILVPLKAIFSEGGRDVVYRMIDGVRVKTPVTVGGRSDDEALILTGVGEGDRVSLTAPGRAPENAGEGSK